MTDYFLPGFKAGGPIRTLKNLADMAADHVRFYFLTRDHDLGCSRPFSGVQINQWASYPQGEVFYADTKIYGLKAFTRAIAERPVDVIYLNSFFSLRSSIAIVTRNWIRPFTPPVLLAPRGEFSPGALKLKSNKKRAFLALARILDLYRNVWWHASTEEEAVAIRHLFPKSAPRIFTAEDPVDMTDNGISGGEVKSPDLVRLVFVSRISPMKNLDGLLAILKGVICHVTLRIYGPIEDGDYWRQCLEMIEELPPNVSAEYCGAIHPDDVSRAFSEGDLFVFPTLGENFGHVIFEALRAGTPVLVSDQTPWKSDETAAITRLPLDPVDAWRAQIESVARLTDSEQQKRRNDALRYARRHATSEQARRDNLQMFQEVARHNMTGVSN